jgi:hypothetical protein
VVSIFRVFACPVECLPSEMRSRFHWGGAYSTGVINIPVCESLWVCGQKLIVDLKGVIGVDTLSRIPYTSPTKTNLLSNRPLLMWNL